jgi:hypothetical protein
MLVRRTLDHREPVSSNIPASSSSRAHWRILLLTKRVLSADSLR